MKTTQEIVAYLTNRVEELAEEADELEEDGLDDSALATECTKQELEEVIGWIEEKEQV